MCGGTSGSRRRGRRNNGLSPRVRGNHGDHDRWVGRIGSIPACAGEPGLRSAASTPPRVYPRVCGGTFSPGDIVWKQAGLSPRVRGNRSSYPGNIEGARSIPACAGEPGRGAVGGAGLWVYPRVCGGTARAAAAVISSCGLSPRVRGNRAPGQQRCAGGRSIPACAGEPLRGVPGLR